MGDFIHSKFYQFFSLVFILTACSGRGFSTNASLLGSSTQASGQGPSLPLTPAPLPSLPPIPPPVTIPPRASSAPNLSVCPASKTAGVDVSDYDPNTNWTSVQKSGQTFTFIKATEGLNFTNPQFARDWPSAQAVGLLRGAYHFFHPADDPLQQAQFFLSTVGPLAANDLPLMIDWETSDNVSSATQIQNALIFLQKIEDATGKIPVLYVDTSYWNSLGNPQGFARYPLFIAGYGVDCPSIPPPWSTWTFWQYADTGQVNGVQTSQADVDYFNGNLGQITQFSTNRSN